MHSVDPDDIQIEVQNQKVKTRQPEFEDEDMEKDQACKRFLDMIKKLGPHSKQILNYSYPPLLYQRGDDEDEEE